MAARKAAARAEVEAHERTAGDRQRVARTVQNAMSVGEIVSVGVVNLVRSTLVTALAGARDVGAELGTAATSAVRGSIRAATVARAWIVLCSPNRFAARPSTAVTPLPWTVVAG